MEHLNKEKLQKYSARLLNAEEMTSIILHLEDCIECFNALREFSMVDKTKSVAFFPEPITEAFHLDFEEHLRPFVDHEANAVIREIVETHTQTCANCAFQLRELREFSESLRLAEIQKSLTSSPHFVAKIGVWFRQVSQNLAVQLALPILILAIGITTAFWFFSSKPPVEIVKNNSEQPSQTDQKQPIASDKESSIEKPIEVNTKSATDLNQPKSEPKPSPVETKLPENNLPDELGNLSNSVKATIRKTLESEKLILPGFLSILGERIKLRGSDSNDSSIIYPKGVVIIASKPTLRWKKGNETGEKYTVEIFDENGTLVGKGSEITLNQWKPEKSLSPGKTYSWEVKSEAGDISTTAAAKFRIAASSDLTELNSIKSPLYRGIFYASKGLLAEAREEFIKAKKNKNEALMAKKFIDQINKGK